MFPPQLCHPNTSPPVPFRGALLEGGSTRVMKSHVTPPQAVASPAAAELASVRALIQPLARSHGLELVDVEWASGPQGRILRVTIERLSAEEEAAGELVSAALPANPGRVAALAGVTLEDCVRMSRDISMVLDVEDVIASAYSLEVSSPGLDRPLKSPRDYRRHVGRLAKVKLQQPSHDGQMVLRGTLLSCDDSEQLVMRVDGNLHRVALGNVTRARLVLEPPSAAKPAAARRPEKRGKARAKPSKGKR